MKFLLLLLTIPSVSPVNWIFPWQPEIVYITTTTAPIRPIIVTPTPPPSPVHCGPQDIPSKLSLHVAEELSQELARTAGIAFEQGNSLEEVQEIMEVGSSVTLDYKTRATYISHLMGSLKNTTIDEPLVFAARREVHKIQRWTRELEVLALDSRKILKETMAVPWKQTEEWEKASEEEKKELIFLVMKQYLCK